MYRSMKGVYDVPCIDLKVFVGVESYPSERAD
jgi:hypothetical protein